MKPGPQATGSRVRFVVARAGRHPFAATKSETAERYVSRLYRRLAFFVFLMASVAALSQVVPGSLDAHWNEGAEDCAATPQPPLQVHAYENT
jgi:hypothetical protein